MPVFDVYPSEAKNYTLAVVDPLRQSFAGIWQKQMADASLLLDSQQEMLRRSNEAPVRRWRRELERLRGKPPLEQLAGVNTLVNKSVLYVSDYEHWNRLRPLGLSL